MENILEPPDLTAVLFNIQGDFDSYTSFPPASPFPAISVIIPLCNAEKYLGECLDSLFVQTFQNFELIIVDDCSTDSSCEIAVSYMPKFNGHLKLYHTEKNSNNVAIVRNIGLHYANGEYIFNMDADDTITKTALEEMYTLAKEHDADVVYCEKYFVSTGVGKKFSKNIHLAEENIQEPPFVDKPTFEPTDLSELVKEILDGRFWFAPWLKLVRREVLDKNKLFFPPLKIGDDDIWTYKLIFLAKKFLRVPNAVYVRRMTEDPVSVAENASQQTIYFWFSPILAGIQELNELMRKIRFFQENPQQRYDILKKFFRSKLSMSFNNSLQFPPAEDYEVIKNELCKCFDEHDILISTLFAGPKDLLNQKNKDDEGARQRMVKKEDNDIKRRLKAEIEPISSVSLPAVSVVIPMYNAELYVGECLDSLLAQTFQNFEVIVADDCSTDKSVEVVKRYLPKFNGRLKLTQTKENSGGGGYVPRNIGLHLAIGEYIFFVDADDFIVENALETLYTAAKDHEADVVYTSARYRSEQPKKLTKILDREERMLLKNGLGNKPTLIVDDPAKNLQRLFFNGDFHTPWTKFVRRDLLIENEIEFPKIISGGDFIWTINVYCYSKRFLRLPIPLYIYRKNSHSVTEEQQEPREQIIYRVRAFILGVKALSDLSNRIDRLKQNSSYFRSACINSFNNCLDRTSEARMQLNAQELYDILHREFTADSSELMLPFFFSFINEQKSGTSEKNELIVNESFIPYLTARMDIKFMSTEGDFKISSVSDNKAEISKPAWLQKNSIGYMINSYAGKLEFVAKTTADGQLNIKFLGKDVRDPKDNSKRIPYWIDYINLTVNEQTVLNKITPVCYDKPYHYNMNIKAGENITLHVEWLPHRVDN